MLIISVGGGVAIVIRADIVIGAGGADIVIGAGIVFIGVGLSERVIIIDMDLIGLLIMLV